MMSEDAEDFVQEFFGPQVPDDIQSLYRESFTVSTKLNPEDDPRSFRDFTIRESKRDKYVAQILRAAAGLRPTKHTGDSHSHAAYQVKEESQFGTTDGKATKEPSSFDDVDIPSAAHNIHRSSPPDLISLLPPGVIFSHSIGPTPEIDRTNYTLTHHNLYNPTNVDIVKGRGVATHSAFRMWIDSSTSLDEERPSNTIQCSEYEPNTPQENNPTATNQTPTKLGKSQLSIGKCHPKGGGDDNKSTYEFMHADSFLCSDILDRRVSAIISRIVKQNQTEWNESSLEVIAVGHTHQTPAIALGRVMCDSEGILNEQSVLLEGNRRLSSGSSAQLLLRSLEKLLIYPGQVIAVEGVSERSEWGSKFTAQRIYPGITPPPCDRSAQHILKSSTFFSSDPMHLMVVAGPFCSKSTIDLFHFERILESAMQSRPHLLIILGPFLDASNTLVEAGDLQMVIGDDITQRVDWITYDDIYVEMGKLIDKFTKDCKVVLVPHPSDVCHPYPIPQPPFASSLFWPSANHCPKNVQFLSNPGYIHANGIEFAVTSCDALTPIASCAICRGMAMNKIELFCKQFLLQQSFFPTHPVGFPIEPSKFNTTLFSQTAFPEVFIFAADKLPSFCKEILGRIFVNTGRVASPTAPFIDIRVEPPPVQVLEMISSMSIKDRNTKMPIDLSRRTCVQVSKWTKGGTS